VLRAPGPVVSVGLGGDVLAVLVQNETAVRLWHLDRLWPRLAAMGLGEEWP
jgi:hypothetical protein